MAKNNQEEVNKQHIVRQVDFNSDDNDSEIDEMLNDLSGTSKTPEEEETPHVDWGAINFKKGIEVNLQPVNLEEFQKTTKIFARYIVDKLNQNPPDPKDDHIREFFKGVKLKIDDDDLESKPATKSDELLKKEDQFILPSVSNSPKIGNEKVNYPQNSKSERNLDMKTSNVSNVTKTNEEKTQTLINDQVEKNAKTSEAKTKGFDQQQNSREYDQKKIDNQKFDINSWQKSIERNPSSKKSAETLQDFSSVETKKTASLSDLEFPQPNRSKYQSRAGMGRARLLGKPRENIEKTRSAELKPSIRTETDTQVQKPSNTEDHINKDIKPNKPDIEQTNINEADKIETKPNKPDIDQNKVNAEIKTGETKQEDIKSEETEIDKAKPSDVNNNEVKVSPVNIETDKKPTANSKRKKLIDLISDLEDGSELKQILLKELFEVDGVKEKRERKPKSSQIAPQLRATMRSASSHQHPVQQSSSQTSQASNQTAWPMSPFYYVEEPNSSVNSTPIPAMADTATTSSEQAHLAQQLPDSLHNATIPSAFKQFEKLSIDVNSHSGHQGHHSFPFVYDHDYYGANNEWKSLGQSLRAEQEQNRDVAKSVSNALGSSLEGGLQLQHQQKPQNQCQSIPQNHKPNQSMALNYRPAYMVPVQAHPQQYYQYQQHQPYFMTNPYYYSYVPPPQSNFMSPPRAKSRQLQIYQQYYSPPPPPSNPPMMYNPYEASNVYSSSLPNSSLYTGYTAASFQPLNHPTTYGQQSNQTPANYHPQPHV